MSLLKENRQRIVKNTALLYVRMFLLMIVTLYTSRVVLNTLGVNDYGIYNLVGGFVATFSIVSGALSSAISRYLTFALGKGDTTELKKIFSTSIEIQIVISLVVIIIAEIVGIWFLNNHLNIPINRMGAANWLFHCSIASFAIGLLGVPYNASIISHEEMHVFAYLSILEGGLKLLIVYLLSISPFDKLESYALLLSLVSIIILSVYYVFCRLNFKECSIELIYDKVLLKKMTSFAGWNFFGNGVGLLNTQGISILINIFFGVAVNAARGIANQVDGAIQMFINNFYTAINPQITKAYASKDFEYLNYLVCKGTKYAYLLMLLFVLPICLETNTILKLWLKIVPDYAVVFVRLTLVSSLCTIFGNTLVTSVLATGNIKRYQLIMSFWGLINFPLVYLAFKLGFSPVSAYVVFLFIYFILIFVRLFLVKDLIFLSARRYFSEVLLKTFLVSLCSMIAPCILLGLEAPSFSRFIKICFVSSVSIVLSTIFCGMDKAERQLLKNQLSKLKKQI
jgi:hypothetical protein